MNVDESETLTKSAMRNYFIFIHHRPEAKLQDVLDISLGKMSKIPTTFPRFAVH